MRQSRVVKVTRIDVLLTRGTGHLRQLTITTIDMPTIADFIVVEQKEEKKKLSSNTGVEPVSLLLLSALQLYRPATTFRRALIYECWDC